MGLQFKRAANEEEMGQLIKSGCQNLRGSSTGLANQDDCWRAYYAKAMGISISKMAWGLTQ